MGPTRRQMELDQEQELKEELHSNFDDYMTLKSFNEKNNISLTESKDIVEEENKA